MPSAVNLTYRMTTRISWTIVLIGILVALPMLSSLAQDISPATLQVSGGYRGFKALAKSVAAVCALIGAIKVFTKFSNGDPDVKRSATVWFGGSFFAVLIFGIIDVLFR